MITGLPQLKRNTLLESENIREYMLRRVRMKRGMLDALLPDTTFDLRQLHNLEKKNWSNKNMALGTMYKSPNDLPVSSETLSQLGVEVRSDRRLCFAGQTLRGFLMPKRRLLQVMIMRGFLKWYSGCIHLGDNSYDLNKNCFAKKEKRFMKMFMKSRNVLWRLIMPSLNPHFYFH